MHPEPRQPTGVPDSVIGDATPRSWSDGMRGLMLAGGGAGGSPPERRRQAGAREEPPGASSGENLGRHRVAEEPSARREAHPAPFAWLDEPTPDQPLEGAAVDDAAEPGVVHRERLVEP